MEETDIIADQELSNNIDGSNIQDKQTNIILHKKKNHFFETYISKVLKQVGQNNGITSNAKQQLNSFLCIFLKQVTLLVSDLTLFGKKKTVSVKEIENALKIILFGELLNCCLSEGNKAVKQFSSGEDSKGSRQTKANIIFPPSIVEKFLRQSKLMVSNYAPVYLAAVLEYLTSDILDISVNLCKEHKHNRITIRDLELAVRNDIELNTLFKKFNITFWGGGVVPFIHSSLLNKPKKKVNKNNETNTSKHRYGTIALKTIKKQQKKSDSLVLCKYPFEKMIRYLIKDNSEKNNIKISKDVFTVLQYFIEQYIIDILYNSNYLTIHAGRVKLLPIDILLYNSFQKHNSFTSLSKNPYINIENVNLLSIDNEINEINEIDDDEN